MAFISRHHTGPDKLLPWKSVALVIGIVLLLVANRSGIGWLGWIAIGILFIGFFLRFLPHSTHGITSEDQHQNGD